MMHIIHRLAAPTPPFFQKVRNIGLVLTAIATAVYGLPVALPAFVSEIAGAIAVAGTVMAGLGQTAIKDE